MQTQGKLLADLRLHHTSQNVQPAPVSPIIVYVLQ